MADVHLLIIKISALDIHCTVQNSLQLLRSACVGCVIFIKYLVLIGIDSVGHMPDLASTIHQAEHSLHNISTSDHSPCVGGVIELIDAKLCYIGYGASQCGSKTS
jgi:hypothetical protein